MVQFGGCDVAVVSSIKTWNFIESLLDVCNKMELQIGFRRRLATKIMEQSNLIKTKGSLITVR